MKEECVIVQPMCYGVNVEGYKDILGIWIGENESSKFWLGVMNDLKTGCTGCNAILRGWTYRTERSYKCCVPMAEIQRCIIHQLRNPLSMYPAKT